MRSLRRTLRAACNDVLTVLLQFGEVRCDLERSPGLVTEQPDRGIPGVRRVDNRYAFLPPPYRPVDKPLPRDVLVGRISRTADPHVPGVLTLVHNRATWGIHGKA